MQTHANFEPGSVVRDRHTAKDYLIEAVVGTVGVGVALYKLVGVLDDRLVEVWTNTEQEFKDQFLSILPNERKADPQLVLSQLREDFDKTLGRDQILRAQLDQAEHSTLRDLVYVARNTEEKDFNLGLVELAEALVRGGTRPNKAFVRKLLQDTAGNTLSQEFLEDLTERVNNQLVSASIRSGTSRLIRPQDYQDLLNFARNEYSHARAAGLFARRQLEKDLPPLTGMIHRAARSIFEDRVPGTTQFGFWPELDQTSSGLDRALAVYRELFHELTGKPMSRKMEAIIRQDFHYSRQMIRAGRSTPLVDLLVKALSTKQGVSLLDIKTGSRIHNLGLTLANWQRTKNALRGPYSYLSGTVSRTSGIRRPRAGKFFRPRVDWQELLNGKRAKRGTSNFLSIDFETFFNDLLGNSRFQMHSQGPIMSLMNKTGLQALKDSLQHGASNTGSVMLSRPQLRRLLEQKAAGDALDLTDILQQTRSLNQALPASIREDLYRSHYSGLNLPTGARAVELTLNKKEADKALAHLGQRVIGQQSEAEYVSSLLAEPPPGSTRMWMVHHKTGETWGGTNLQEVLDYMEAHGDKLEASGVHTAEVKGQLQMTIQQLFDVPQNRPLVVPQQGESVRTVQDLLKGLRYQGIEPAHRTAMLTQAEIRNVAHTAQQNKKQAILDKVVRQRMAVALIKNPQGEQIETKFIATGLRQTTIEKQMELIQKLYSEGGMVLDIETRKQLDGQWLLRELGYSDRGQEVGHIFDLRASDVIEQKVKAFIAMGQKMQSAPVVASHTDYDLESLLSEAQGWREAMKGRPELQQQLNEALHNFQAVGDKWLDLTVLHQFRTGERGNMISQAYLALKHLHGSDRVETHTAVGDVQQAWQLIDQAGPDVLQNIKNAHLSQTVEQHTSKGLFFLETDPRGARYGRLLMVEDYATPIEGGAVAKIREYTPSLVGGRWKFTPSLVSYEERGDSVYGLLGMLGKRGVQVSPETFGQHEDSWRLALSEQAEREFRDLTNVGDLRPYARYEKFTESLAQDLGPHGIVQYRARLEARWQVKKVLSKATSLRGEYIQALQDQTGAVRKPLVSDFLDQAVSNVMSNFQTMGRTVEGQDFYRNMVTEEVWDFLRLGQKGTLYSPDTVLGKFERSALGKEFERSLFDVEENPFRPMLLMMHAQNLAFERMGGSIPPRMYGHRLGGTVAGARVSLKLGDLTAEDIHRSLDAFPSWGADMLLNLDHGHSQDEAHQFFSHMLGSNERADQLRQAVSGLRGRLGIDKFNTESWKDALIEIQTNPRGPEEQLVMDAYRELQTGSKGLHHALQKLISQRQEELVTLGYKGQDLLRGKDLSGLGDELIAQLERHRAAGHRKIEDVFKLAISDFRDKHGEQAMQFLEGWAADQSALLAHIAQLPAEDAREVISRTDNMLNTMGDALQQDSIMEDMVSRTKGQHGIERTRAMLTIAGENQNVQVRMAAGQASAARQATPTSTAGRVEQEVLHETVNRVRTSTQTEAGQEMKIMHELMLRGPAARFLTSIPGPLLAVGGIVGLLAGVEPRNDSFSQGEQQDAQSPAAPYAARYAEIPGQNRIQRTWSGEPQPWQLDITFEGFVKDKREQEELLKTVYDAFEGHVVVKSNHTAVQDERNVSHRQTSRELLRRNL